MPRPEERKIALRDTDGAIHFHGEIINIKTDEKICDLQDICHVTKGLEEYYRSKPKRKIKRRRE